MELHYGDNKEEADLISALQQQTTLSLYIGTGLPIVLLAGGAR